MTPWRTLFLNSQKLHDPLQLERSLRLAELAIRDQHQLAIPPADRHRPNYAMRALIRAVEVLHEHRLAMIERFLQFQRQQRPALIYRQQAHRPALLLHGVDQRQVPSADRLHQSLEDLCGCVGVGQSAVRSRRRHAKPRREHLKPVPAASKSLAGDADGVEDGRV